MSSATRKDDDEYERTRSIPVFMGVDDLENYRSFMTMFEGWEDKEDTHRSTSLEALVEQLPNTQEYWNGWREHQEVDEDGDVNVIHVPLTDEEKQRQCKVQEQVVPLCWEGHLGANVNGRRTQAVGLADQAMV